MEKEINLLKSLMVIISNKKEKEALEISKKIFFKYNSFYSILREDENVLKCLKLPKKTIKTIMILKEILNQTFYNNSFDKKNRISSLNELITYLKFNFFDYEREVFKILYFNAKNELIKDENIFYGTVDKAILHTREIVKNALKYNSKSLIIIHNHPSGNVKPSLEDIEITKEIKKILDYFEIRLSDHIIVSNFNYYSFCENKMI